MKCFFLEPRLDYVGHEVDSDGIHPSKHNVDALCNAPVPTNVSELKAFLGLMNYHQKFISDLATTIECRRLEMKPGIQN